MNNLTIFFKIDILCEMQIQIRQTDVLNLFAVCFKLKSLADRTDSVRSTNVCFDSVAK